MTRLKVFMFYAIHFPARFTSVLLFLLLFNSTGIFSQTRVIVDLDIDSDVDDVSALAMLNTLHNRGTIKLLGVIVTSDDPYAAGCSDAVNTYFGNGTLPVGVLRNQPVMKNHSRYTASIAEQFPNRKLSPEQWPDATSLYRELLSKSPDGSVVIVSIGHLSNLQNLLKSSPDKFSKLDGLRLANKKARQWLCMGGQYPSGKEANFYRPDPASTVYCLSQWTKPVIFAGWEVGGKIITGGEYLKSHLSSESPVYKAYELYNNFKGRASWDQVAVLLLLPGMSGYFDLENNGYCTIAADGSNEWIAGPSKNHSYVKIKPGVSPEVIARMIDDMAVRKK